MILTDKFGRRHDYLRISLTDRCNLRCTYCAPIHNGPAKALKSELLNFDELTELIRIFLSEFEIKKVRFTGGEPLVRHDIIKLLWSVNRLKKEFEFETALTTNGTLLPGILPELREMGLNRLNISLDTLNRETFREITGKDELLNVLESIEKAEQLKFDELKINSVILKGINDQELPQFIDFIKDRDITLRFIEYMPFGTNSYSAARFLSMGEVKERIRQYADIREFGNMDSGVAELFSIEGFKGKIGFISPMSNHFCGTCNRLRIKSDGKMKLCLFSNKAEEVDLRQIIRSGGPFKEEIKTIIHNAVQNKEKEHAPTLKLMGMEDTDMLSTGG